VTNHDKKDSIRGRMADAGEPFNVARRKVEAAAAGPVPDAEFQEIKRTGRCDLSNRELTVLPPEIGQLTNLRQLALIGNQLTALPPEIGQLTNLETLRLEAKQLTLLPPAIGQLTNLKRLAPAHNQLTALPPEIGQLTNLKTLRLNSNWLTTLPRELADLLSGGLELDLTSNPLQGPILEMYGQGPQALASYLRGLE
jgi:Leucine-rich repeat (LRR) protein